MTSRAFPSFLLLALAASAAGGADARCHRSAMNAAASAGDYSAPSAAPPAGARPFHNKSEQRELGSDEDAGEATVHGDGDGAGTARTARENGEANRFQAPVPVQAPRPAVPPPPERVFSVAPGDTLRGVLTRWAASSGWEVVWEPANDYALSAAAGFTGPFPEAVTRLLESLQANGAPYGAELYKGNRVIRVTRVR